MKKKLQYSDWGGSDDDIPVSRIKLNTTHESSLYGHKEEICEFCDKSFQNRYRKLIHNADHIIIPLLNLSVVQCSECLFHFTCQEDLDKHVTKKHETSQVKLTNHYDEIRTEPVRNLSNLNGSIRNKILFEEDVKNPTINSNTLLMGSSSDVKIEVFGSHKAIVPSDLNNLLSVPENLSVPYEKLIKPGVYSCKCKKTFPDRFELIKHQVEHMTVQAIKTLLCGICQQHFAYDKFHQHVLEQHPEVRKIERCKQCGFRCLCNAKKINLYNYTFVCKLCNQSFSSVVERAEHIRDLHLIQIKCPKCEHLSTLYDMYEHLKDHRCFKPLMNLCPMCLSFFKNGTVHEIGICKSLMTCYLCKQPSTILKMVKSGYQNLFNKSKTNRPQPKMSNETRLKNIQTRLKRLSLLNRL